MSAKFAFFIVAALASFVVRATALADGFAGLGQDAAGFEKVAPGTVLAFPRDFGAHRRFRTEWWYVTANLEDAAGASYGVQWTLFARRARRETRVRVGRTRISGWATRP